MEIKKADSKGRVSGFIPGDYYTVSRTDLGTLIVTPLEPDDNLDIPFPANEKVLAYLKDLGVNPRDVSVKGISRTGYDRLLPGTHRAREEWPVGFEFEVFTSLVYGRG